MTPTEYWQDGPAVERQRKSRGLTRQALADKVELHVDSLKNIEYGRRPASLGALVRIADALDTPLLPIVRPGSVLHRALTRDDGREVAA